MKTFPADALETSNHSLDPLHMVIARMEVEWLIERADRTIASPNERRAFRALIRSGGSIGDACDWLADQTGANKETLRTQMRRAVQKIRNDETNANDN